MEKVFIKMPRSSNEFLTFMVIFTLSNLNRFAFGKNLLKFNKSTCVDAPAIAKQRKLLVDLINNSKFIDGHVFALGIITLLQQFFENNYLVEFIELFATCLFEMLEFNANSKHELSLEIVNGIDLIEVMLSITKIHRNVLEAIIPKLLLDKRDYLLTIIPNMS